MNTNQKDQVLGLGNTYLGDDAVGIHVVREIESIIAPLGITVNEAEIGGFDLALLLGDFDRVIIVDAVKFGNVEPGTVTRYTIEDFKYSVHTAHLHGVNLPTALEIIGTLGMKVPNEIIIIAIEADEIYTFGSDMTDAVKASIGKAKAMVLEEIKSWGYDL